MRRALGPRLLVVLTATLGALLHTEAAVASSLSITPAAASAQSGQAISLAVTGSSDYGYQNVDVYDDPSGGGCAATSPLEYSQTGGRLVTSNMTPAQPGSFSFTDSVAEGQVGTYSLCGYLNQSGSCLGYSPCGATEATASVTVSFYAAPPPPPPPPPAACTGPGNMSLSITPRVLGGRPGSVAVHSNDAGRSESNVQLSLAAASPSQPIRFPESIPITFNSGGIFPDEWGALFQTALGDGPIVATLTWMQWGDWSVCVGAATAPVDVLSTGDRTSAALDWDNERSVTNWDEWPVGDDQQVDLRFSGTCEALAAQPALVVISGARQTVRIRLADVCGRWRDRRHISLPHLNVYASDAQFPGTARLTFEAVGNRNMRNVYRLHVSLGTRSFHATITASVEHHPTVRIYRGTDAFVNYCIDEGKQIRSSNGRLYCVRPGSTNTYLD